MKLRKLLTTIAIVSVVLIAGCKKDDFVVNVGLCPEVFATSPLDLASGVPLNKVVTATFNKKMNGASITQTSYTLFQGTTQIPGAVSYNVSDSTASFTPTSPLVANSVYTATVKMPVKDFNGNTLAADYVWTFSTGIIPTVILTDPINLAINVPLNKVISATFSQVMNNATINATTFKLSIGLTPVLGTVTPSGATATLDPNVDLLPATTYTVTITTGAQNTTGIPLTSNYVWTFTTANPPPTIISTDPLHLATNVPLDKVVSANFSEAMKLSTINGVTFTLKLGTVAVPGAVTYSGTTAFFTPTDSLYSDSTYTAKITTGAQNLASVGLARDTVWTFSTRLHKGPQPPALLTAVRFGAFGGTAGVTNQGLFTVINNGGISTTGASTLITGFHDAITGDIYTETPLDEGHVSGGIFTAPPLPGTATSFAIAQTGLTDATNAYLAISPASKPGGIDPNAGELGGLVLPPGIYKAAGGSWNLTLANLTLDAQGDKNAVFIFQAASSLTVGIAGPTGARSVLLVNGAQAKNVYWYVGSSATINGAGGGVMVGNIIANSGVTFSTAGNVVLTTLNGRALSLISSVTMVNTIINVPAN